MNVLDAEHAGRAVIFITKQIANELGVKYYTCMMNVALTVSERQHLRQLQKQRRDDDGYVKVTVVLMLDAGRGLATVAQDLGLDETTVYRYVRAFADLGLEKYLAHEQSGYWGLLNSAQLAHLCREVNTTLHTDCKALQAWLLRTYRVACSLSCLTDLLHRLGFTYKLTTPALPGRCGGAS